jgi:hypothetical protein
MNGTDAGRHGHERREAAGQRIELQIDELVLHGFARIDRYRIARALESELARLISTRGMPPAWEKGADLRSLDGSAVKLPAGARPDVVGRQVAREVYWRMRR